MRQTDIKNDGDRNRLTTRKKRTGRPHYARLTDSACGDYFAVPPSSARPKRVFVNCHYCGYDSHGRVPENGICPKCGGRSWDRFAMAEPLVPEHMK